MSRGKKSACKKGAQKEGCALAEDVTSGAQTPRLRVPKVALLARQRVMVIPLEAPETATRCCTPGSQVSHAPGECRLKGGTMSHNTPCWEHLAPYPTGSTAQGPRREPKGFICPGLPHPPRGMRPVGALAGGDILYPCPLPPLDSLSASLPAPLWLWDTVQTMVS